MGLLNTTVKGYHHPSIIPTKFGLNVTFLIKIFPICIISIKWLKEICHYTILTVHVHVPSIYHFDSTCTCTQYIPFCQYMYMYPVYTILTVHVHSIYHLDSTYMYVHVPSIYIYHFDSTCTCIQYIPL